VGAHPVGEGLDEGGALAPVGAVFSFAAAQRYLASLFIFSALPYYKL